MEDESSQRHPGEQPLGYLFRQFQSNTARRWPRAMGIVLLAFGHLAFFLPLRAFVPVSSAIDAWWGMGLALADGTAVVVLIRTGLRKLIRRNPPKENQ